MHMFGSKTPSKIGSRARTPTASETRPLLPSIDGKGEKKGRKRATSLFERDHLPRPSISPRSILFRTCIP